MQKIYRQFFEDRFWNFRLVWNPVRLKFVAGPESLLKAIFLIFLSTNSLKINFHAILSFQLLSFQLVWSSVGLRLIAQP